MMSKADENDSWTSFFISGLSVISVLTIFFGVSAIDKGSLDADNFLWILGLSFLLGTFTLGALIERVVVRWFSAFKVSNILWAAVIAIALYIGRKAGIDDVNAVFHIDASALPMTTVAASIMALLSLAWWPVIIVLVISGIVLFCSLIAIHREEDGYGIPATTSACLLITYGFFAAFISKQFDEEGRHQKIYRIAQSTDFSSTFRCAGIEQNDQYVVLFIGPDQKRVMVAPKLTEPVLFLKKGPESLRRVAIPADFPILDCVSNVDFEKWKDEVRFR